MNLTKSPTLPTALIIGPQRCGTTWVHEYLGQHPQVTLPMGVKETFFFDRRFANGLPWYLSHFPTPRPVVVEVAPTYFHGDETPSRISACLGACTIICILRDPSDRAFSLYLHEKRKGRFDGSFREALERVPEILDSSRYAAHVQRWRAAVGFDHVHVLFYEDLAHAPEQFAAALCAALGIEPLAIPEALRGAVNPATVARYRGLATAGRRVADLMRDYRLYAPIQWAKKLGLKSIFFGKSNSAAAVRLSADDRSFFIQRNLHEIEMLERMVTRNLDAWKAP